MTQHIGVLLCTCDGKIEERVDVDALPYVMRANRDVALVQKMPHLCASDGIQQAAGAIRQHHLDRVVVAACSARLQTHALRDACAHAGVNSNHFACVDWREGCVDAHAESRPVITGKAIDLIQMGVARVANAYPAQPAVADISPHVLVLGGGTAGLTAASTLADSGIEVTLVEREKELGGQQLPSTLNGSAEAHQKLIDDVLANPKIHVLHSSRLAAVGGRIGKRQVKLANGKNPSTAEFEVGAILVATGAAEYSSAMLYRHDGNRVVTLSEFESRISSLHSPSSIVYILCAGSRDDNITYCSNVCCLDSLKQAIHVMHTQPASKITILFRDLCLNGDPANEEIVRDARRLGIEFVRYSPTIPPRVSKEAVTVHDEMTRASRTFEYDRLVLATPIVPQHDAARLARQLNLGRDADGFFLDAHHRVRPEGQIDPGIFVCGSAHRPVDMETAILQGMTAAARAARFVRQREIRNQGTSAWVDTEVCTGCAQCIDTCAFGAIEMTSPTLTMPEGSTGRAAIDPFLCLECGNCAVACPSKAIDLPSACDAQILAQISCALAARQAGHPTVLVFACHWSGFAAMELAGARHMTYPADVRVIELPCSARLDPLHVLCAFSNGAEKVLLALCPPNECHFGRGNADAERRISNLRAQLAEHGIDPQRLQLAPMLGDDAAAWVKAIDELYAKKSFNLGYRMDVLQINERRHA